VAKGTDRSSKDRLHDCPASAHAGLAHSGFACYGQ
jgi:hypothetical protein